MPFRDVPTVNERRRHSNLARPPPPSPAAAPAGPAAARAISFLLRLGSLQLSRSHVALALLVAAAAASTAAPAVRPSARTHRGGLATTRASARVVSSASARCDLPRKPAILPRAHPSARETLLSDSPTRVESHANRSVFSFVSPKNAANEQRDDRDGRAFFGRHSRTGLRRRKRLSRRTRRPTCFSRARRTPRRLGSGRVRVPTLREIAGPNQKHAESGVDAMDSQTQMMLGYHYLLTRAASMGVLPDGILNSPQSETDRNALAGSLEAVRRRPESPGKRTRSFAFPFRPPRFIPGVPGHPLTLPRRPSTCDRRCWNTTRTCSSTTWLWRRSWGFSPRPCCRRAETRKRKSRCRRCST